MIHFLSGTVASKSDDSAVIAVGGVGFHVTIPITTYRELPPINGNVLLHTYLHLREDEIRLFGFASEAEREMFEVLISVSGVGAKMAVDVISVLSAEQFIHAVQSNDLTLLCQAPGIGKKRAERLVFDLKNSKHTFFMRPLSTTKSKDGSKDSLPIEFTGNSAKEAVAALTALGLKPFDAQRAVSKALESFDDTSPDVSLLIKESLKHR
jgi:Holliday junction DNA helicase RuvA